MFVFLMLKIRDKPLFPSYFHPKSKASITKFNFTVPASKYRSVFQILILKTLKYTQVSSKAKISTNFLKFSFPLPHAKFIRSKYNFSLEHVIFKYKWHTNIKFSKNSLFPNIKGNLSRIQNTAIGTPIPQVMLDTLLHLIFTPKFHTDCIFKNISFS